MAVLKYIRKGGIQLNEKILVVDDDKNILELITIYLEKEGYEVLNSLNGKDAIDMFKRHNPNLILLDLMLPQINGKEVCSEIRKTSNVPIVMVTAKGEIFDKVIGLELGADDYLVKPFDPWELVARVKAVLRRSDIKENLKGEKIIYENLIIDSRKHQVKYHNINLQLPLKEFELLSFLASNPNKVYTRDQLLDKIWGYDFIGDTRTVDVHVKRIREKLDKKDSFNICTVWGVGYKFEVE